jgi:hypothetical protein
MNIHHNSYVRFGELWAPMELAGSFEYLFMDGKLDDRKHYLTHDIKAVVASGNNYLMFYYPSEKADKPDLDGVVLDSVVNKLDDLKTRIGTICINPKSLKEIRVVRANPSPIRTFPTGQDDFLILLKYAV